MLPTVAAINALEPGLRELSDIDLAAKTIEFKERIAQGATLDDLLIEAFAVVREAGRRVLNMRHFDVQLIGGMVLHKGKIAEMKTGEGKTLVATLPVYLNALEGKGVHVVTVNDYLARRDSEWMGRLYKFLGLHGRRHRSRSRRPGAQGRLQRRHHLRHQQRVRLRLPARQHEVPASTDCVQRAHHFAIVDEVDSILIDEARTPLIISGPSEESTDKYYKINRIIPKLMRGEVIEGKEPGEKYTTGDYTIDEKHKTVGAHRRGRAARSRSCSTSATCTTRRTSRCNHHVQQALRAHVLYQRDREYVVRWRRRPKSSSSTSSPDA